MIRVTIRPILGIKDIVGRGELELTLPQGSNLEALLSRMVETWGQNLSDRLFSPDSANPLPHIRLAVNGRDIGFLDGLDTVLEDGDEILMIPPVAGG